MNKLTHLSEMHRAGRVKNQVNEWLDPKHASGFKLGNAYTSIYLCFCFFLGGEVGDWA